MDNQRCLAAALAELLSRNSQRGSPSPPPFPRTPFFSLLSSPCADAQKRNSKIMVAMGVVRAAGKETPMVPEIVYTSCPKELRNSYRFTILASYHPSNAKCLVPRTLLQWSHAYPRKTFAPFVFARRASAASNRPIQCVATRLSVFPVVIFPSRQNSDARRTNF